MTQILIGADPEVFVKDPKKNKFLAAYGIIPGTKKEPYKHNRGTCQVDGVAMEFNVDPSPNATRFLKSIEDNLSFLSFRLNNYNPDLVISCEPTATFDDDYFQELPPEAKEMGCDPDHNAYTGEVNPPPATDLPLRAGGGHIHIGWGKDFDIEDAGHILSCCEVVRQLDVSLFIASHLYDKDTKRRTLYGRPGAFRPKPYGCEYRVLSNRWVRSPHLQRWVFNTTVRSVKDLVKGRKYFEEVTEEDIQFFIEHGNSKTINETVRAFADAHPQAIQLPIAI